LSRKVYEQIHEPLDVLLEVIRSVSNVRLENNSDSTASQFQIESQAKCGAFALF
jgi:hypothetical protein